jgi:hypothetical protein
MVRARLVAVFLAAAGLFACTDSTPSTPTPNQNASTCTPSVGAVCQGRNNYIEFVAGDFPVVISVPHGGALAPLTIPDRTGTTVTDSNTIDLGRAIVQAFGSRIGRRPHLVLVQLRRTKLDANRELAEGAQGNLDAINAWNEYHAFVELAMTTATAGGSRGLYIDLHGHGHTIQRLELGYLLSAADLDRIDADLNGGGYAGASSLRLAMSYTNVSFAELLRGPSSLGGLLGTSTPSVPSPAAPTPGSDPYFEGGYSTQRHSARLPGLQIESNFDGVRDTAANRAAFAERLVTALLAFLDRHLGVR